MNKIYATNHYTFIDRVVIKKRQEMCDIINNELSDVITQDALDIGSTNDTDNESSNYLIKNLALDMFLITIKLQMMLILQYIKQ